MIRDTFYFTKCFGKPKKNMLMKTEIGYMNCWK
jgi:hypothetical protein